MVPKGAKLSAMPKPVLAAAGSATATRTGGATLKIKLTGKGKAVLKRPTRARRR